jgi:dynactin complex subunit
MQCVFCKSEIEDYTVVGFDVITSSSDNEASSYLSIGTKVAMLECPHCDMIFFMKSESEHLKNMHSISKEEMSFSASQGIDDITKLSAAEKKELYEKMKKELIEKFKADDPQ